MAATSGSLVKMQGLGSTSGRLVRAQPNSLTHYGIVNQVLQPNKEKLGELHMRLNLLLGTPVRKLK